MTVLQSALLSLLALAVTNGAPSKPNIVYIVTDDQDIKLGSLEVQDNVRSLLVEKGISFKNAFVSTPVCCPSRSSILTGKYVHNHKTYENGVESGCNAPSWRELNEKHTVGAYMSTAGYKTGFFGKYLNHYAQNASGVNVSHIPQGWDFWFGLVGNSKYLNYDVSWNGQGVHMDDDYDQDYFTNFISQQATFFIDDNAKSGKPLFLYIAPPAPHRPATPAPQYAEVFMDWTAPRTPSYGVHGADKHWIISDGTPVMTEDIGETIDDLYRDRLRTLLSVDDLVSAVVGSLDKNDLLNNTYIIYNSDHGYHLGQFNQQGEKRQPYDEDIRVPLIVTGPGITPNSTTTALALNIDMAPTILDLAGAAVPDDMDGVSLKQALMMGDDERQAEEAEDYQFLVEYYGEGKDTGCMGSGFIHDCHNNTFLALRLASSATKQDFLYAKFYTNDSFPVITTQYYFTEYYDLTEDPWQVKNMATSLSPTQQTSMESVLEKLYKCAGQSCRQLRTPTPQN